MVRFVHMADSHLGRRQYGLEERERDFLDAFNEAVDRIVAANPEFVAFSGDLFDSYRPSPTTLVSAFVGLRRIVEAGIRIYAVAGNHDLGPLPGGGRASPLPLFEEAMAGSFVNLRYSRPLELVDGLVIVGLPYTPRQEAATLKSALERVAKRARERGKEGIIAILHQAVHPLVPPQKSELSRSILDRLAFSYYAMGHVHDRNFANEQRQRRALAYAGSTEIVEEREADKLALYGKGFYVVELEGDEALISPVSLKSVRPFLTYRRTVNTERELEDLQAKIESEVLRGNWSKPPVVRVSLASRKLGPEAAKNLQRALQDALSERVLRVFVRYRSLERGEREDVLSKPIVNVEEVFEDLLPDEKVRLLALEIYRLYTEGKGGRDLARELERIYQRWKP
ncbi:MAG TPA: DNA repair exonuclease [Candidatus Korarchaeota archaeon]|nr:DNA repair exonuclease [Candidatus Korarchaeota archaeon]